MRLVEEDTSYVTYGETWESYCTRYDREADLPITIFKRRCFPPNSNHSPQSCLEVRLMLYPTT